MTAQQINKELGNVDLYLLDQILKNNIPKETNILDAGCGEGRNLIYFLNNGYHVSGIDHYPDAINMLKFIIGSNYPNHSKEDFSIGSIENLPYENGQFGYIICLDIKLQE